MKKYILFLSVLFVLACENEVENASENQADNKYYSVVSEAQFNSEEIEIGSAQKRVINSAISVNGIIEAPPNSIAGINPLIGGKIKEIKVNIGDKVRKGEVLALIQSTDLIELQKDFLMSFMKYKALKQDFERITKLVAEDIAAKKELIQIESEYKSTKAQFQALKLKLELLNMDISKIENGDFKSEFPLIAPISGFVSQINLKISDFVEPDLQFIEIVNSDNLRLSLNVFERDIYKFKVNSKLSFYNINNPDKIYNAEISHIGKNLDLKSKSVNCYAKILDDNSQFINNSFVKAQILTDTIKRMTIPNTAIFQINDENYALEFVKKENGFYYFNNYKLKLGSKDNNFSEVLNVKDDKKFAINGIYNLVE